MTGKTHASCGMLVGALTTQYFQTDIFSSVTVIILATLASLLPDICHTQSKIGRRFKVISFFVRLIFGHRTFTHSILFIAIIAFLLQIIQTPNYYMASNYNWVSVTCYTRYDNTKRREIILSVTV